MVGKEEIIEKAKKSILNLKKDEAKAVAQEAIDENINLLEVITGGFTAGMEEIGKDFEAGKLFIPHIILAAEVMDAGIKVLTPELEKMSVENDSHAPKVIIGTIEGDIHSIGKDIVVTMLKTAGFNVIDIGRDVPVETYVESVKTHQADVVASSSLMTTTMVNQLKLENQLCEEGVRDGIITMVGGAPTSQAWAEKIGADIYAENALAAVSKLKESLAS